MASGHLGSLAVDMLEPQGGDSAFNAFLSLHGDGIFSIVYEVPSQDEMAREVERMGEAGVPVLQRMQSWKPTAARPYSCFSILGQGANTSWV